MNEFEDISNKFLSFTCDKCGYLKNRFCVIIYNNDTIIFCKDCYNESPRHVRSMINYFVPNWFRMTDKGRTMIKRMTN